MIVSGIQFIQVPELPSAVVHQEILSEITFAEKCGHLHSEGQEHCSWTGFLMFFYHAPNIIGVKCHRGHFDEKVGPNSRPTVSAD